MPTRRAAFLFSSILTILAGGTAPAQNFVVNPDFGATPMLSGWQPSASGGAFTPYWSSSPDHTGGMSSGSAALWVLSGDATIGQCVPVTAGTAYDLSAYLNDASGSDGTFEMRWTWHTTAGCSDGGTVGGSVASPAADDAWHQVVAASQAAPPGSMAVKLSFYASVWTTANVDDVSVSCSSDAGGPAVTPPAALAVTQTLCP